MSATAAGILQLLLLVALLALAHRPLGDYMAWVFTGSRHLGVERAFYRVVRVDPDADQRWARICSRCSASPWCRCCSCSASSGCRVICRSPGLPWCPGGRRLQHRCVVCHEHQLAVVFGRGDDGPSGADGRLAVQNFLSAAVGLAVAVALIRGLVRTKTDRLGNFWVDIIRATLRILLPLSCVFALVLVIGGRSRTSPAR